MLSDRRLDHRRLEPRPGDVRRGADGTRGRAARRRRARDGARGLVSHHDVTWIASAMSDEDRAVAPRPAAAAVEEQARDGSPYRLRLVAHDPSAYDWYYNVVSNPTLWFLQHYLWGLDAQAEPRPRAAPRLERGLRARQPRASRTRSSTSSTREPDATSSSTTTTSTSRRASCATRGRTRCSRTSSTSRGPQADYWHVLPEDDPRATSTTGCSRTTSSASTRAAGGGTSCARREDIVGAESTPARTCVRYRGRERARHRAPDRHRPRRVRARSRRATPVLEEERLIVADAAGEADRARRPHRSVEEHRPRLPRVRALPRRASRAAGRVVMLALLDPSRQDIPAYAEYLVDDPARGAARQRALPARRLAADRARRSADNFHAVGRGVQAVRRAAREPDLRRDEPRREGGAARQRARRRRCPLRERRRPRGARRLGDLGQPVRHRGPGGGAARGAEMPPDERRRAVAGAIREHVREHDVEAWVEAQLDDLDRAPRGVSQPVS